MVRSSSFPFVLQAYASHTKDTALVHTMGMEEAPDHGTVDGSIVTVLVHAILMEDIRLQRMAEESTSGAPRNGNDDFAYSKDELPISGRKMELESA